MSARDDAPAAGGPNAAASHAGEYLIFTIDGEICFTACAIMSASFTITVFS